MTNLSDRINEYHLISIFSDFFCEDFTETLIEEFFEKMKEGNQTYLINYNRLVKMPLTFKEGQSLEEEEFFEDLDYSFPNTDLVIDGYESHREYLEELSHEATEQEKRAFDSALKVAPVVIYSPVCIEDGWLIHVSENPKDQPKREGFNKKPIFEDWTINFDDSPPIYMSAYQKKYRDRDRFEEMEWTYE